ncbi:MAG: hypothetical protein KDA85_18435, partial [Planctomycetaceae bacterium]|nr:hypothetical protein [Planctomycetaceae bacterium]
LVFHRAFDRVTDQLGALEELCELGFQRILTSGGAATASQGIVRIQQLATAAAGRIEILPGGGIRANNVMALLNCPEITQLHTSCSSQRQSEPAHRKMGAAGNTLPFSNATTSIVDDSEACLSADSSLLDDLLRVVRSTRPL